MIRVVAVITTEPGRREEVLELFKGVVPTVLQEDGCREYSPVVDVPGFGPPQAPTGPDTFFVIESWESAEALRAHGRAPHMLAYRGKTEGMIAKAAVHVLAAV